MNESHRYLAIVRCQTPSHAVYRHLPIPDEDEDYILTLSYAVEVPNAEIVMITKADNDGRFALEWGGCKWLVYEFDVSNPVDGFYEVHLHGARSRQYASYLAENAKRYSWPS